MYQVGNASLVEADVTLPNKGIWVAMVRCAPEATFTAGQVVDLQIGSLKMKGYVARGGNNVDSSRFTVIGGYGGWRRKVTSRFYKETGGVTLSLVVRQLADEVREKIELSAEVSGIVLGETWTRSGGSAAMALEDLRMPWRVRPDGTTVVGALSTFTAKKAVAIRSYSADTGTAIVDFPEDSMDECLPGAILSGRDITVQVSSARILQKNGRVHAEIQAEGVA